MPKQVNRIPGIKPLVKGGYQARVFHAGKEESRSFPRIDEAQKWQRNLKKDLERCPEGITRKNRSWVASLIARNGVSSSSFSDLDDAISWMERGKILISMGTWVDPDQERVTFGEFSTQWRIGKNSVSGKTLATYDSQLRLHVLPYFRNLTLTGITTADVRSWVSKLNSERTGATTIRQSYRLFRQIMESAYLDERISRNPCAGIQLPKITTADKRGLTREELNALANACGDYSALIMFLGTTGLRIGEALALKGEDIDQESQIVHVRRSWTIDVHGAKILGKTKTGTARKVPISPEVLRSLSRFLDTKGDGDWVFLGPKGNVLDYDWFRKAIFVPATTSLGLEGITIHSLRHTCASLLIKLKAPITTVSHILGHASVKMTLDTYGHYYEDDTAEWINHLGQFVATASAT